MEKMENLELKVLDEPKASALTLLLPGKDQFSR